MADHTTLKRCAQCSESFPATTEYFTRSKNKKDGLYPYCRTCRAVNDAIYRAENAEAISEKAKLKRLENHDEALEKERREREARREEINEVSRRYYARHREERRHQWLEVRDRENEKRRQWRAENPELAREKKRSTAAVHKQTRRARQAGLHSSFTTKDWQHALAYFGGCCAVCGRPQGFWHTLAADHWIPLSAPGCPGTVPTNMVPLCHGIGGCNNSKNDRNALEWLTSEYGLRKGQQIAAKIQTYFGSLGGEA